MENHIPSQIIRFNLLFKRYDDIYRKAARKFDMPELSLWILYVLRGNPVCTQKDIVDQLLQSKQSIHSALKLLERDGCVETEYRENNHKSKYIHLTEKGTALAEQTADKIVAAENKAFRRLNQTEREAFLDLFERLTLFMDDEMNQIT